jgi:hypothetical protein
MPRSATFPRVAIRITNAAAIYTIMILVFIAGMWVILAFGSTLQAQPDLAGEWELLPEGRDSGEAIRATIEQSGRYVRMKLPEKQYDLRISSSSGRIELTGDANGPVTFDPSPSPSTYRVTLAASHGQRRRYSGRITQRTYPHTPAGNQPQTKNLSPSAPAAPSATGPTTHAH